MALARPSSIRLAAIVLTAASTVSAGQDSASPYGPVDPAAEAMRRVRAAMTHRSDGSHHLLLTSLRQLRAETLHPLFEQLVEADHWTLRLDGILGMAELSGRSIDPALLEEIADPTERSAAVRAAISLDLVDVPQALEMLEWTAVPEGDKVALLSVTRSRGGTLDAELLATLASHSDVEIAGPASVLLATSGDELAIDRVTNRIGRLRGSAREAAILAFARMAERHRVVAAVPSLTLLASADDATRSERLACLAALLAIDVERGLEVWTELFERATSNAARLRTALLLLASEQEIPVETLALFSGRGEVLEALGAAGIAVATETNRVAAFERILRGGHRMSVAWAMTALLEQPDEVASAIYEAMLKALVEGKLATPVVAIEAAARLVGTNPDAMPAILAEAAAREEAILEAILVGMLSSEDRTATARIARGAIGLGGRRCDSLAVLAVARAEANLTPEELELLALAAAGGGRLDPSLEVQAAWLYLDRLDRIPETLAIAAGEP